MNAYPQDRMAPSFLADLLQVAELAQADHWISMLEVEETIACARFRHREEIRMLEARWREESRLWQRAKDDARLLAAEFGAAVL